MTAGGFRKGSGRKSKYGEPTVNVTFRIPKSKVSEVKGKVMRILKKLEVKR